jgi:hypothetical protein
LDKLRAGYITNTATCSGMSVPRHEKTVGN